MGGQRDGFLDGEGDRVVAGAEGLFGCRLGQSGRLCGGIRGWWTAVLLGSGAAVLLTSDVAVAVIVVIINDQRILLGGTRLLPVVVSGVRRPGGLESGNVIEGLGHEHVGDAVVASSWELV